VMYVLKIQCITQLIKFAYAHQDIHWVSKAYALPLLNQAFQFLPSHHHHLLSLTLQLI
jgi:hypothetical protein